MPDGKLSSLTRGDARNGFVALDRPAVNRGDIPGPYVYVSFRVDSTPQFGQFIVTSPEEARSLVRLAKINGYDFIKVYNNLSPECFYASGPFYDINCMRDLVNGWRIIRIRRLSEKRVQEFLCMCYQHLSCRELLFEANSGDSVPNDRNILAAPRADLADFMLKQLRRHVSRVAVDSA